MVVRANRAYVQCSIRSFIVRMQLLSLHSNTSRCRCCAAAARAPRSPPHPLAPPAALATPSTHLCSCPLCPLTWALGRSRGGAAGGDAPPRPGTIYQNLTAVERDAWSACPAAAACALCSPLCSLAPPVFGPRQSRPRLRQSRLAVLVCGHSLFRPPHHNKPNQGPCRRGSYSSRLPVVGA